MNRLKALLSARVSKKILFEMQCQKDIDVFSDRAQIGQVMLNLLTNAAEAIANVGTVRTTLSIAQMDAHELSDFLLSEPLTPGTYARIEVEDDGSGMDEIGAERIFEPFFSTKFAGRGLGLAVVFGAAKAHAGAIRLRTEKGVETKISFVIPYVRSGAEDVGAMRKEAVGHGMPALPERTRERNERVGTILVADDERAVRRVVVLILKGVGWRDSKLPMAGRRSAADKARAEFGLSR